MKLYLYKITINASKVYRLMNSKKISLTKGKIIDDTFEFVINANQIKDLEMLCQDQNIAILSCSEFGIVPFWKKNKFLKLLLILIIVFISIIYFNSLFLWNIEVQGNYSYSSDTIINYIQSSNLARIGKQKSKIDAEKINVAIRNKYNSISWVSCQVKGTNLIVSVKENYITEISKKEKKNYSIVAAKDGVINSIIVRNGTGCVKKGQKVKKGDMLIDGMVEVLDESEQPLFKKAYKADGDVTALVNENIKASISKKVRYKYDIKQSSRYYLTFKNTDYKTKKQKNNDYVISTTPVKLFKNIYFPLKIKKIVKYKYKQKEKILSKIEAKSILDTKMNYKLSVYEQKGYKISSKNVKILEKNNQYVLQGVINLVQPIGSVKYIDTNNAREEETKTYEHN